MKNEDVERMDDELGAFTRELEERGLSHSCHFSD